MTFKELHLQLREILQLGGRTQFTLTAKATEYHANRCEVTYALFIPPIDQYDNASRPLRYESRDPAVLIDWAGEVMRGQTGALEQIGAPDELVKP